MTSTLKDGWTGSVVWPGTEFLASEEGLRRWAWGGQVEEVGVPVQPTNHTRRGKRRVVEEEGPQDTFSSKEVFQTQVTRQRKTIPEPEFINV
jgi:hypothetical protein